MDIRDLLYSFPFFWLHLNFFFIKDIERYLKNIISYRRYVIFSRTNRIWQLMCREGWDKASQGWAAYMRDHSQKAYPSGKRFEGVETSCMNRYVKRTLFWRFSKLAFCINQMQNIHWKCIYAYVILSYYCYI